MRVPADLRRRIEEGATTMMVPPEWVLRACIDIGLDDADENSIVLAVEAVRDDPRRAAKMPGRRRPRGAT